MDVRPGRSLGLLSAAHAVNHAFAVLLPPIFLAIIDEFGVTVQSVAFLAAFGSLASGLVQLSYAELTRHVSRKRLLTAGGLLFGGDVRGHVARVELHDLRDPERRRRASAARRSTPSVTGCSPSNSRRNGAGSRSVPISPAGIVGTVLVAIVGTPLIALIGWRGVSVVFGIAGDRDRAVAILAARPRARHGPGRCPSPAAAACDGRSSGSSPTATCAGCYLTSVLGGGGRGLGVVNLFALIYLTRVIGLDEATSGLMYGVLIVLCVPMPPLAGGPSDRWGRKPLMIAACTWAVLLGFGGVHPRPSRRSRGHG